MYLGANGTAKIINVIRGQNWPIKQFLYFDALQFAVLECTFYFIDSVIVAILVLTNVLAILFKVSWQKKHFIFIVPQFVPDDALLVVKRWK